MRSRSSGSAVQGRATEHTFLPQKEISDFFVIDLTPVVNQTTLVFVRKYNRNEPAQPGVKAGGQP